MKFNEQVGTLAGTIILVTIAVTVCVFVWVYEKGQLEIQNTTIQENSISSQLKQNNEQDRTNQITQRFKDKPLMTFVRDGNVWLLDLSKKDSIKQITNHVSTRYNYNDCFRSGCPQIEANFDENFYSRPEIDPAYNTIAYLCLSEVTLQKIAEANNQNNLPNQAIEPKYDLCLMDMNSEQQQVFSLPTSITNFQWSNNGDKIAAAVMGQNLVLLEKVNDSLEVKKTFLNSGPYASFKIIKWSPNDDQILISNAYAFRLVDISSSEVSKPFNDGYVFFADWLDNSTIIYPRGLQKTGDVTIVKNRLGTNKENEVFIPNQLNWYGFIELSPDKNFFIYPSGAINTVSIDYDLTLRDRNNSDSYTISSLFPDMNIGTKSFIAEHKWLPDNSLIFSLYKVNYSSIGRQSPTIWRLYPKTKELRLIIDNAFLYKAF